MRLHYVRVVLCIVHSAWYDSFVILVYIYPFTLSCNVVHKLFTIFNGNFIATLFVILHIVVGSGRIGIELDILET